MELREAESEKLVISLAKDGARKNVETWGAHWSNYIVVTSGQEEQCVEESKRLLLLSRNMRE